MCDGFRETSLFFFTTSPQFCWLHDLPEGDNCCHPGLDRTISPARFIRVFWGESSLFRHALPVALSINAVMLTSRLLMLTNVDTGLSSFLHSVFFWECITVHQITLWEIQSWDGIFQGAGGFSMLCYFCCGDVKSHYVTQRREGHKTGLRQRGFWTVTLSGSTVRGIKRWPIPAGHAHQFTYLSARVTFFINISKTARNLFPG